MVPLQRTRFICTSNLNLHKVGPFTLAASPGTRDLCRVYVFPAILSTHDIVDLFARQLVSIDEFPSDGVFVWTGLTDPSVGVVQSATDGECVGAVGAEEEHDQVLSHWHPGSDLVVFRRS